MGFLEDIKRKQADENFTAEQQSTDSVERNLPAHVLAVEPQLPTLRDRLTALAKRLNAAPSDVYANYQIGDYASLRNLKQSCYEVICEDINRLCVSLKFSCHSEETVQFETNNRDVCDRMLDDLLSNGLKVHYRSYADWKFLFT